MGSFAPLDDSGGDHTVKGGQGTPSGDNAAVFASGVTAGPRVLLFTASEDAEYQAVVTSRKSFFDYERHYQDLLMTLEGDDILDQFRAEYESLHNSLVSTYEGEGRLLRKCANLQADIDSCIRKVSSATELTMGDRDTITKLRDETERSSKKLGQIKEKEAQLREVITTVKQEIVVLQAKALEPIDLPAQEFAIHEMRQLHESLQREEERLTQLQENTSRSLGATQRRIATLLQNNTANIAELTLIRESISRMEEEAQVMLASKVVKEEELRAVRETTVHRIAYCTSQQHMLDALSEDHERNGQDLRDAQHEESRLAEEHQGVCRQLQNVHTALQESNEENNLWQRRMRETAAELQRHEASAECIHSRFLRAQQVVEALQRRNAVMEAQISEQLERKREATAQLRDEEATLVRARQVTHAATQAALSARKEVDLLHEVIADKESEQRRNKTWLAEKGVQLRMLEGALAFCEEKGEHVRQELCKVAKEAEANDAKSKKYAFSCALLLSEVENRNHELTVYEETFPEMEARIRHQQALLGSMVAEQSTYTSHCDHLKHGLSEQQHHLTVQVAKVTALRSAIQKREKDTKVEAAHIQLLSQQRTNLEQHLTDYQEQAEKRNRYAVALGQEILGLREVLRNAADETARQQRRCNDVLHERDSLNRQETDRSMEVRTLYQQAKTDGELLQRLEGLYIEQAQQLEHLEYQTVLFEQQLKQMRMFVARLPELRVLLNNATRELQREKVRVRALLDEAGRPLNLHPYTELVSAEPETYALLQRVHKLQRILVQRRTELDEKQAAIQTAEQRYMKAKVAVAQQPGPEIAEQLIAYQQNLVKKNQHMGQMQEALEFFRSQTDLFKARHDVLRDRLTEMGKAYAENRAEQERGSRAGARNTSPCLDPPSTTSEPTVYRGFVAPPRPTTESVTTPASLLTPPPVSE